MHRIDTQNAENHKFVDGNPNAGKKGTIVDASFLNSVQEEISKTIEDAGITLSKNNDNQLTSAVKNLIFDSFKSQNSDTRITSVSISETSFGEDVTIKKGDIVDLSFILETYTEIENTLRVTPFDGTDQSVFVFHLNSLATQNFRVSFVSSVDYTGKIGKYKFGSNTGSTILNLRVRGFIIKR